MGSVERYSSGNPQVVTAQEAASQSFDAGDLVYFNTSGQVAVATFNTIDGIARKDASGTQTTALEVELLDPNAIYSVHLTSTSTHAQTLVGDAVGFVFTATAQTANESATADAYVVALDPRDAVGTASGRILIRFYGALLAAHGS